MKDPVKRASDEIVVDMIVQESKFCAIFFTHNMTYDRATSAHNPDPSYLAVIFNDDGEDPVQYAIREGFRELPKVIDELRVSDKMFVKLIE